MKLYKYCSYSQHLLGSLAKNTIWLSSSDRFNDIFDCKFKEDHFNEEQLYELIAIDSHRENNTGEKMPLHIISQDPKTDDLQEHINKQFNQIKSFIEGIGVMSMSEIPDSLLLWAHYAANHTGVCLEYEVTDNCGGYLMPVTYSTQYPVLSIYDFGVNVTKSVDSILTTKSMEWAYEKEWRYTKFGSANQEAKPPFNLKSIIFGAKLSTEHEKTIRAIVGKSDVRFKRAIQSKTSYSLKIESAD